MGFVSKQNLFIVYIYIYNIHILSLRSGGKDMATSANFPRDFGRFVAKSHLACEECACMVG